MFLIREKALGHYDVAVCGGGVAGVAAAVTAAREGAFMAARGYTL